jgi:hypothetical protein
MSKARPPRRQSPRRAARALAKEPRRQAHEGELVVLLHGLKRTSRSMRPLERLLVGEGFEVVNQGYPSLSAGIDALAAGLARELRPRLERARVVHFVTHSMGGIVVRAMRAAGALPRLGRVVMLAPPNQGSEVVDFFGATPLRARLFDWFNGPAGAQLGTGPVSVPNRLPPADFELGVIAGERSSPLAWLLSAWGPLFPGGNDGKVGVARTRLQGMRDFLVVAHSHTFLMGRPVVQRAVVNFLLTGAFAGVQPRAASAPGLPSPRARPTLRTP